MLGVVGVKGHAGGYAEKLRVAARQLVAIPEGVGWHDAAVHCDAGLTAWHAVGRSRLAATETVLVIGVGGVGSFAVQFARLAGARVVAAERTQAKLDWARKLGVDEAILFSRDRSSCARPQRRAWRGLRARHRWHGRDHGAAAIDAVAVGGRIVVVGYTPDSFTLAGKRLAQNELEVIRVARRLAAGSRGGACSDCSPSDSLHRDGSCAARRCERGAGKARAWRCPGPAGARHRRRAQADAMPWETSHGKRWDRARLPGGIGEGPVYLDDKSLRDPIRGQLRHHPTSIVRLGARKRRKRTERRHRRRWSPRRKEEDCCICSILGTMPRRSVKIALSR